MECLKMLKVRHGEFTHTVPCGKCAYCLMNKRSQWMFRIHHEMRTQEYPGWFLTLTYHERFVKRVGGGRLSLRFRDVQLFLKKLRKAKYYAKYICVGEYGAETKRPHYHMLLWTDCPVNGLEKFWSTKTGLCLGRIHVGSLSMRSAMYTLKYIIQPKQKEENGIEKTRAQFSKGIGLAYLSKSVYEYHTFDYDAPNFTSYVDGAQVALPRYYRYKIFTKYQLAREGHRVKWQSIKKRREKMREVLAQGVKNSKEYMHALRVDECQRILKKTKYNQSL